MAFPPFGDEKIWGSLNGRYQVYIRRKSGDGEYEIGRTKEISLRKKSEISYGSHEIMGVREIIGDKSVRKSVFLDARDERKGNHLTANALYVDVGGYGKLLHLNEWSWPMKEGKYEGMPDDEFYSLYRIEQIKNGICNVDELPPYIYIEATIDNFIRQINKRDFSPPALVPRNVSQEEINKIEKIMNEKQKMINERKKVYSSLSFEFD